MFPKFMNLVFGTSRRGVKTFWKWVKNFWVKNCSLKNIFLMLSNARGRMHISRLEKITHRSLVIMEKHKNQQYINASANATKALNIVVKKAVRYVCR